MHHQANIGLIDAHAERHRRHHRLDLPDEKSVVDGSAPLGVELGVVRADDDTVRAQFTRQRLRQLFRLANRGAVHHDGTLRRADATRDVFQISRRAAFFRHHHAEVRSIDAVRGDVRVAKIERGCDIAANGVHGGGGERHHGHLARGTQTRADGVEGTIRRAEIVTPLRQTVRLVDGDEAEFAASIISRRRERKYEDAGSPPKPYLVLVAARADELLGGDVDDAIVAAEGGGLDGGVALLRAEETGEGRGVDGGARGVVEVDHLVLHERDEGGHHEGGAAGVQRGHLVTQRLAAARGPVHARVATGDGGGDHLELAAAEVLVAEVLGQGAAKRVRQIARHGSARRRRELGRRGRAPGFSIGASIIARSSASSMSSSTWKAMALHVPTRAGCPRSDPRGRCANFEASSEAAVWACSARASRVARRTGCNSRRSHPGKIADCVRVEKKHARSVWI